VIVETRVVAEELDLTTATSLRELLESAGIAVELTGAHDTAFPGTPQFGAYGIMVDVADYDQARQLIDELEREAGKPASE
jgi:Putative prokaryotic signal transducing protein